MNFRDKLETSVQKNQSLVCVGLDLDLDYMGERDIRLYTRTIIEATADLVCAYKPNWSFYEALGAEGIQLLLDLREFVPPAIPIIGDVKRGDVGNTSVMSARGLFDVFGFDAVTVNPWGGRDSLEPYMGYRDKGVFVWCRSSNPGAEDFQSLEVTDDSGDSRPMYEIVAEKSREWNEYGNIGLVVGATYPKELQRVRELCPDQLILIPGVGLQGGDLQEAMKYGTDSSGGGALINAGRAIIYASRSEDYGEAARAAALRMRDAINAARAR